MNKVNYNTNGGFGELLDDLTFEQEAIREAFYGILSAFGINPADSFIISGCAFNTWPSPATYTAGYISINGEVLKVDAGSVPVGSDTLYWDVDLTYNAAGDRLLENATSFQAYQVRKAKLFNAVVSPGTKLEAVENTATLASKLVDIVSADNSGEALKTKILAVIAASNLYAAKTITDTWHVVGSGGGEPAFQNGWTDPGSSGAAPVSFRKDNFGRVQLRGWPTGITAATMFTLPAGYRPPYDYRFSIVNPAGNVDGLLIQTDGTIHMSGAVGQHCLDGISFFIN